MKRFIIIVLGLVLTLSNIGFWYWYTNVEANKQIDQINNLRRTLEEQKTETISAEGAMLEAWDGGSGARMKELVINFEAPTAWKSQQVKEVFEDNPFSLSDITASRYIVGFQMIPSEHSSSKTIEGANKLSIYNATQWVHNSPQSIDDDLRSKLEYRDKTKEEKLAYIQLLESLSDNHELNKEERIRILLPTLPAGRPGGVPFAKAIVNQNGLKGIIYTSYNAQYPHYSPYLHINLIKRMTPDDPRLIFILGSFKIIDQYVADINQISANEKYDALVEAAIKKYSRGEFDGTFKAVVGEIESSLRTMKVEFKSK